MSPDDQYEGWTLNGEHAHGRDLAAQLIRHILRLRAEQFEFELNGYKVVVSVCPNVPLEMTMAA